jgi:hypothetical protein
VQQHQYYHKIYPLIQNLRQFKSKAITACGEEMQITGIRDCEIQLGKSINNTSLLVSPEAQVELLLGLDYLSACEITNT